MVGLGIAALLALSFAPAASAQNGFPAAKAAVDQYEPPPPPPPPPPNNNGNNGNGNNGNGNRNSGDGNNGDGGNRRPSRGSQGDEDGGSRRCKRTSRNARRTQAGCPAGGAGPDTASGGPGGVRSERGGPLPLAEAQGGRLPFTGLDLLMIASLGALLLAVGFGARAASRARPRRG